MILKSFLHSKLEWKNFHVKNNCLFKNLKAFKFKKKLNIHFLCFKKIEKNLKRERSTSGKGNLNIKNTPSFDCFKMFQK